MIKPNSNIISETEWKSKSQTHIFTNSTINRSSSPDHEKSLTSPLFNQVRDHFVSDHSGQISKGISLKNPQIENGLLTSCSRSNLSNRRNFSPSFSCSHPDEIQSFYGPDVDGFCPPIWCHSKLEIQGVPISLGTLWGTCVSPHTNHLPKWWRRSNIGKLRAGGRATTPVTCHPSFEPEHRANAPSPRLFPAAEGAVSERPTLPPGRPRSWGFWTNIPPWRHPSGPLRTPSSAAPAPWTMREARLYSWLGGC